MSVCSGVISENNQHPLFPPLPDRIIEQQITPLFSTV
jgi:hypothetical protein